MNVWDESRQANNAIEMMLSGNYAFPTYNGQPDFWNTKPHLLIAIQAFFMKILGPGLLALRLPSAIAGFITVLIWFKFIHERNGFYSAAVFVLVLLTCSGFNVYHVTRTGDYDALLVLFISLATIGIIQMENSQPELKKAIMAGLWISLAALTKSVAVLLWIPSWILLIYWQRRNLGKNIYLFSLVLFGLPLLTMLIYYGFREWLNTGYVSAVWQNEWIGRYLKPNEGHVTNFD
jgi:4-amino-4-deoxy-L-arabinose transferase-like glycosyltransferase